MADQPNSEASTPMTISDLPSPSTSSSSEDVDPMSHHDLSDAEREWRESLQQLELLLTMVLVPYLGKYFGRKAAYWGWAKFMTWNYPVEVHVTDPVAFKGVGALQAASSL